MKPSLSLACLAVLLACQASAQTIIIAAEASKHKGEQVYLCDTVYSIKRTNDLSMLILGSERRENQVTILIRGFELDSSDYYKGSTVCVNGLLKDDFGKPEIELSDPERITAQKSYLLSKDGNKTTYMKVVKVTLTPPPGAHHFGEGYRTISLIDIDKENTDTIKIIETISSYQLNSKMSRIDFGGVYPKQRLTVVLKRQAKQYLDAMLEIQYRGSVASRVLLGKKFMAIGTVSHLKGKPQIIITSPDMFTVIPD